MATVVLGIAGSYFGPIGTAIGTAVGSYIDNKYLFKEHKDRLPIENLQLQEVAQGGPALACVGQEARVHGQIIFQSEPKLSGGEWTVDVAVGLADHPTYQVVRVYAEGFEIYDFDGTRSYVSPPGKVLLEIAPLTFQLNCSIVSPAGEYDLTQFRAGVGQILHQMTGWTKPTNNRGDTTPYQNLRLSGKGIRNDQSTYIYLESLSPTLFVPEPTVSQVITLIQKFIALDPVYAAGWQERNGAPAQTIMSHISDSYGPGAPPAFEGLTCFALKGMKLTQFGQRLPQYVSILDESGAPCSITRAVDKIFERGGWVKGSKLSWNTSALNVDKIVRGYVMHDSQSIYQRLEPLTFAFDLAFQIRDGEVYVFHPSDARVWTVPEKDWGFGESASSGLFIDSLTDAKLPNKISLHYVDRNAHWEDAAVERHRASGTADSVGAMDIDLRAITMENVDAVEIADRLLWRPHREQRKFKGSLPPKWHIIAENDIIATTFNGRAIKLAVSKSAFGVNREVRVEGNVYEQDPPNRTL